MRCCVTISLGYFQLRNPQGRAEQTHGDAIHRLGLQYNHVMSHASTTVTWDAAWNVTSQSGTFRA